MLKQFKFLLILALVCHKNTVDWQGTGNLTQDNMTFIRGYINTNFHTSWTRSTIALLGNVTLINFSTSLSTQLNKQWAPAWNVFVIYIPSGSNSDSVLYGYAFRDHWLWFNGLKMNDGYYVTFIIWKDYNCIKWYTFDYNNFLQTSSTYSSTDTFYQNIISPIVTSSIASSVQTDIWSAAKNIGNALATNSSTSSYGWTVITSQDINPYFFGYFCAKDFTMSFPAGLSPTAWGISFIIQTR